MGILSRALGTREESLLKREPTPKAKLREIVVDLVTRGKVDQSRWECLGRQGMDVIRSHGVGPWLFTALSRDTSARIPAEVLRALAGDFEVSALCGLALSRAAKEVLENLGKAGIPAIVLKGAYLEIAVYDDPAHRPRTDLDLLIPQTKFSEARKVLESLGYGVFVENNDLLQNRVNPTLTMVLPGRFPQYVDLHWGLVFVDYYRPDASSLWNEAVECTYNGVRVYAFRPEMNFLHIALHAQGHSAGLRDWLDMVMIATRTDMDWERLFTLAESLGLKRPLYWALKELKTHWRLNPPSHVLRNLCSYQPHWLEDRVLVSRFRYGWRIVARLRALPDWSSRLSYLYRRSLGSTSYRQSFGSRSVSSFLGTKFKMFVRLWKRI